MLKASNVKGIHLHSCSSLPIRKFWFVLLGWKLLFMENRGCGEERVSQAELKGEFHRYAGNTLDSLPVSPHFIIHLFFFLIWCFQWTQTLENENLWSFREQQNINSNKLSHCLLLQTQERLHQGGKGKQSLSRSTGSSVPQAEVSH